MHSSLDPKPTEVEECGAHSLSRELSHQSMESAAFDLEGSPADDASSRFDIGHGMIHRSWSDGDERTVSSGPATSDVNKVMSSKGVCAFPLTRVAT